MLPPRISKLCFQTKLVSNSTKTVAEKHQRPNKQGLYFPPIHKRCSLIFFFPTFNLQSILQFNQSYNSVLPDTLPIVGPATASCQFHVLPLLFHVKFPKYYIPLVVAILQLFPHVIVIVKEILFIVPFWGLIIIVVVFVVLIIGIHLVPIETGFESCIITNTFHFILVSQ